MNDDQHILGKGLEALIPPQYDGEGSNLASLPSLHDDPEPLPALRPTQPSGPVFLHVDFGEDPVKSLRDHGTDEADNPSVNSGQVPSVNLDYSDPVEPSDSLQSIDGLPIANNNIDEQIITNTEQIPTGNVEVANVVFRPDIVEQEQSEQVPFVVSAMASMPVVKKEDDVPPSVATPTSPKDSWADEALAKTASSDSIFYLEVSKVHPNPHQPRKHFDEAAIKDLASSIREFGIIQPLVVSKVVKDTPSGTQVEYELIAGERRLMASKYLGLETVPAIIRNIDFDRERLELAIIENLQRENLNPIEMARAFARLQDEFRMTQREVAVRLGKSRETVANTLRLLDLSTDIQEALEKNQISESHGRLLLAIDDPALQEKIFRDLLATRMTTRELRHRVDMATVKKERTRDNLPPELQMFKERLTQELGAPVEIQGDPAHGGKITISFYSGEELAHILERFGKQE